MTSALSFLADVGFGVLAINLLAVVFLIGTAVGYQWKRGDVEQARAWRSAYGRGHASSTDRPSHGYMRSWRRGRGTEGHEVTPHRGARAMFGIKRDAGRIEEAVRRGVSAVLGEYAEATEKEIGAIATIRQLRTEKEKLEDELSELRQEIAEKEREIEHKVGLARIRQEAEAELAEQKLEAREDQLQARQDLAVGEARVAAREEAMKRADELLGAQVKRMEDLVGVLVGALPKAEMVVEMSKGRR